MPLLPRSERRDLASDGNRGVFFFDVCSDELTNK